jgi:hypothetical protein
VVFVDSILRLRHAYLGAGEWAENIDVATIGGTVVAVAPAGSLHDAIGPDTAKVDTGNTYAYPGFVDSHTHTKRAALIGNTFLDCGAGAVSSLTEILDLVAKRSAELPPGEWLQGDNLNPSYLREGRFPDRYELDAAGSGRPIILRGSGRHVVIASSSALAAAGIDAGTHDPPGGRIERDEHGQPTGVLHERAKLRLDVTQPNTVVPNVSVDIRLEGLRTTLRRFHGHGTTTIHEIPRNPDELSDYLRLRAAGDLSMRVVFYVRGWEAATRLEYLTGLGLRSDFGDDRLRIGGVKFSIDGSASFRNAAVNKEYPDTDSHPQQRLPQRARQPVHHAAVCDHPRVVRRPDRRRCRGGGHPHRIRAHDRGARPGIGYVGPDRSDRRRSIGRPFRKRRTVFRNPTRGVGGHPSPADLRRRRTRVRVQRLTETSAGRSSSSSSSRLWFYNSLWAIGSDCPTCRPNTVRTAAAVCPVCGRCRPSVRRFHAAMTDLSRASRRI